MIIVQSIGELAQHGLTRVAVACGIFDGVHTGHQRIIRELIQHAADTDSVPVVMTFDPHPLVVLRPSLAPPLLLAPAHRLAILANLGVRAAIVVPFTAAFARLTPDEFVTRELVVPGVELTHICVGAAWRFGHQAQGDVAFLRDAGRRHGFGVTGVALAELDGETVSSSRVRQFVAAGDLDEARRLLGRPFSIRGPVAPGKGIATSTLRYPTANVTPGNDLFPPTGIYAATAWLDVPAAAGEGDGAITRRRLPGVLYLGNSPTFVANQPAKPFVEMHIFDFAEDIYGRTLEVDFLSFIRGDKKYDSAEALSRQIALDVAAARTWHVEHPAG